MSERYAYVLVEDRSELRSWLAEHHEDVSGIWLVTWKKGSGHPHVPYDEIVEEALCFGWIDSQPRSLDATRSARLLTKRNPRSNWSRLNKERVERLAAAGLMTPAGLAAVAAAKANGVWTALDDVEDLREPSDLSRALDEYARRSPLLGRFSPLNPPGNPGVDRHRKDRIDAPFAHRANRD